MVVVLYIHIYVHMAFPIVLDHRSVHCTLNILVRKGIQLRRSSYLKGWHLALDQHGNLTVYQHCIRRLLILNRVCSADSLLPGMVVRRVIGFVLFHLNNLNACGHAGDNAGSTIAKKIVCKFELVTKKIASMEVGTVVPFFGGPWQLEAHTTFLAPKCWPH